METVANSEVLMGTYKRESVKGDWGPEQDAEPLLEGCWALTTLCLAIGKVETRSKKTQKRKKKMEITE